MSSSRLLYIILNLLLLICGVKNIVAQSAYSLKIQSPPGLCVGGEVCQLQPAVAVVNPSTGIVVSNFVGVAYATMGKSLSGSEALYLGSCTYSGCGAVVIGASSAVPFVGGVAQFQNLQIRTAGTGYTLRIYGRNSFGAEFAVVETAPFPVSIGPIYQMAFGVYIGAATGGKPFTPNPIINMVDRGGNLISTVYGVTVTASLIGPTGKEVLQVQGNGNSLASKFFGGQASFTGLYVNEAGYPNMLVFNASMAHVYIPPLYTRAFPVAIGPAAGLTFVNGSSVSAAVVEAGEFFKISPRVAIVDAGGNPVVSDSTSGVMLTISENPSQGSLLPTANTFGVAVKGVVTFTSLRIDKAGQGYRLMFTVYKFSPLANSFTQTSVSQGSDKFNVVVGPPRKLGSAILAGNSWAGGQPFGVQPMIELRDYGDNVLVTNYASTITATMIESLSVRTTIKIETFQTFKNTVNSVSVSVENGVYGAGEVMYITVNYFYEVWMTPDSSPYLVLSVRNAGGTNAVANYIGGYSRLTKLQFLYTVAQGDSVRGFDYNGVGALNLNGAKLVDGVNQTVSTDLFSPGIVTTKPNIIIDTSAPYITRLGTSHQPGEYGAGEAIYINITFSCPIAVEGVPYLVLNTSPLVVPVNQTAYPAIANFSYLMSDATTMVFLYNVQPGHAAANLTLGINKILFPSIFNYSTFATQPVWIRRLSTTPTTPADVSVPAALVASFAYDNPIEINTDAPILDAEYGVRTKTPSGTYYPGEVIYITMRFTKDVVVHGVDTNLLLSCGPPGRLIKGYASIHKLHNDFKTVEFIFRAFVGANTSSLDIVPGGNALFIPAFPTFIRRKSTVPTTDVNPNTTAVFIGGRTLVNTSTIALYGLQPVVKSVYLVSTSRNLTLHPDDFAIFAVSFTARMVATCPPVVVIDVGNYGEATYYSGNHTDTFLFKYKVGLGAISKGLNYRYNPNAFCLQSGCPYYTNCLFQANSTVPTLSADIMLPFQTGNRFSGVPIPDFRDIPPSRGGPLPNGGGSNFTVNPTTTRGTWISSVYTTLKDGVYGGGTVIYYYVKFTDRVTYVALAPRGAAYPSLYLNIGRYANYTSGSGTNTLVFLYVVTNFDSTSRLSPTNIPGQSTALRCYASEKCRIQNVVLQSPNISTQPYIVPSSIVLDYSAPHIVKVWSNKPTSPYDGFYSAGEQIIIFVEFNLPVMIQGQNPRLMVNVTNPYTARYAYLFKSLTNATTLAFQYIVQAGDFSQNMQFVGPTIDRYGGLSYIYKQSLIPSVQVNYTLPADAPVAIGGNVIFINTINPPAVVKISSISRDKTYYAGDHLFIRVDFNHFIISSGYAYVNLNCGDHASRASYVGWVIDQLNTTSPEIPTAPTKHLYFKYTVGPDDFNFDLDYVDRFSFSAGVDRVNGPGTILAVATFPTLPATLDLFLPGSPGSIAHSSDIYIDGRTAFETSLAFLSPSGTYGLGDPVYIQMNFSKAVVVVGSPQVLLDTGSYNRPAVYYSGSGSHSLIFRYDPQPGDYTRLLDYAISRAKLSSAADAFQRNGGHILVKSANPILEAFVAINPVGSVLAGSLEQNSTAGVFTFLDLSIRLRGPDYLIRFSGEPAGAKTVLTTTQTLFVSFSNEYELIPEKGLPGDLIGHSVAISGDITATGAPHTNWSVTAIQTVTTTGGDQLPTREVQVVKAEVDPQPAVQSFHSTAAVGVTVGGFFRVWYGTFGPTRPLPANADPTILQAMFNYDLAILGNVTFTRQAYIYCACENAFTWTITFHDILMGDILPLTFDDALLTGTDAKIDDVRILQPPAKLSGGFSVSVWGKESALIQYDAGVEQIRTALAEIDLVMYNVEISPSDASESRSWTITFDAHRNSYDIPVLGTNSSQLRGGTTRVWSEIIRPGVHGPLGLWGYFTLEWRGNVTSLLPAHATAEEVKEALELLSVIETVNVTRSNPSSIFGYTWTIEFVSVKTFTPRGYVADVTQNVESIIPHNYLIGTNTSILIGAKYGFGDANNPASAAREGTYGIAAGAVYLYQQNEEMYMPVATIRGTDTNELDQFGHDVALNGDLLLVSAPGADLKGLPEIQSIFCSAASGYFQISFRGWLSDPIGFNASIDDFISAMEPSLLSVTINVADWGEGGLCQNNTATITFLNPTYGATNIFSTDTSSHLELMQVVDVNLTLATGGQGIVKVEEVQAGTQHLAGTNADPQQIGSAYLFQASYNCPLNISLCVKSTWNQVAQFHPSTSSAESYGFSVALSTDVALVGAPGLARGYTYVYVPNAVTGVWAFSQKITVNELDIGAFFGYSVAVWGDTLVVGAPYNNNHQGAVITFKRTGPGATFSQDQTLLPNLIYYPLMQGDLYGCSVSIDQNTVVAGAADRDASTIYLGNTANPPAFNTGAVFVFERLSEIVVFGFVEALTPSNVREYDRFGFDVAISEDVIVVGSIEDYNGLLGPYKTVIEVKTQADYGGQPVGSFFYLMWTFTNTTGHWAPMKTRPISCDATAAFMKKVLEADLLTGTVLVTRSNQDMFDGGYAWAITFTDMTTTVPILQADITFLTGTNAAVAIEYLNPTPPELRGKVHIFQRTPTGKFVEQFFLVPFTHQPIDRCGWSVAVNENYAIVGCPNRDQKVPGNNNGASIVYYLSLLHIEFSSYAYSVVEGQPLHVTMQRTVSNQLPVDVLFYISTLDRNAMQDTQLYLQHLYGVTSGSIPYPQTIADFVGVAGNAIARTQYYGSTHNESVWIDGMYDYRGISDYVPIHIPQAYLVEYDSLNETIIITPDTILEKPDENVSMIISTPGIWPSRLGRLFSFATIVDSGNGNIHGQQFDKVYKSNAAPGAELGYTIATAADVGVMFTGSPKSDVGYVVAAGSVVMFTRAMVHRHNTTEFGRWTQHSALHSPNPVTNGWFGDAVAVDTLVGRNTTLLVIGEPNTNSVYVYVCEKVPIALLWTLETTLTVPQAFLPQHRFGVRGAIGISNDLLVIGAPGLEAAFVFIRMFNTSTNNFYWAAGEIFRSSDYDYDVIFGVLHPHRQEFGTSVAASLRSFAVGAPYASYDKLGSDLPEVNWDTEGIDIFAFGRGKAYVWYSSPCVQMFRINSNQQLLAGTFRIQYAYRGVQAITSALSYATSASQMKAALQALPNIDEVDVSFALTQRSRAGVNVYQYTWTVTFTYDWQEPGRLLPQWGGYGCKKCVRFSANYTVLGENRTSNQLQMECALLESIGPLQQQQALAASDARNGDRFGSTIALDGNQLMVGAPHSSGMVVSTWDFEAGTLVGWSKSGTSFDYQPTYGDNSYMRPVYAHNRQSMVPLHGVTSKMTGLYYIGTFEKRPGSPSDFRIPDPSYPAGSTQGDEPQGTLTSGGFLIKGTKISFLIGGGCDYYTIYVELLIDGMSTHKATGLCDERMHRASFDVGNFVGRVGQLRVVDASSSSWGHINVDDFTFDWDVSGARVLNPNNKVSTGGLFETPQSGAVYAFLRHKSGSNDLCVSNIASCVWDEEAKLAPSDKRQMMHFGTSLSIDNTAGVAVIGAPGAECTGFYKELPSTYPYINSSGASIAAPLHFPLLDSSMPLLESIPTFAPGASGAYGVLTVRANRQIVRDPTGFTSCGAAYVFRKDQAHLGSTGNVALPQHWYATETMKLQAGDAFSRDYFGTAVSLSSGTLTIGSIGQDGDTVDAGAIYSYSAQFAAVGFLKKEFPALEGTDAVATVVLVRNLATYSGEVVLEYATSDLTATGVDKDKFAYCQSLAVQYRGPAACGDYQQTKGTLIIPAGANSGGFYVPIMNDYCNERFLKYIQITIAVPGSNALEGELISAKVRIDDDDFLAPVCNTFKYY